MEASLKFNLWKVMYNILIIDDDIQFGESLLESFEDLGYSSMFCSDIKRLESFTNLAQIDVVLLDLRLGGLSGINFISQIKSHCPKATIIVMTGFGTISTAVDAIKKGADEYVTKPVTAKKILDLLKNEKSGEENSVVSSLDRVEREYIEYILSQENGNISKAAKRLGIHRQSLQRKLKKWVPTR